jgi:hypothetical protein
VAETKAVEPKTAKVRWYLARIEALEHMICSAAPLTWVSTSDLNGAQRWEREAVALLGRREG